MNCVREFVRVKRWQWLQHILGVWVDECVNELQVYLVLCILCFKVLLSSPNRPIVNCIDYLTEQNVQECVMAAVVGACCVMSCTLDIGHTQ